MAKIDHKRKSPVDLKQASKKNNKKVFYLPKKTDPRQKIKSIKVRATENGVSSKKVLKKKVKSTKSKTRTSDNGISSKKLIKKKPKSVKTKKKTSDDEITPVVSKKKELKLLIEELQKDPTLLTLRKCVKLVPRFLKSEAFIKKLTKEIIRLWSEAGEKIRVLCLLCLVRIYTKLQDKEKKQLLLKKVHTTFLEKARITKLETMSMIGFMRHSLIELYKLDLTIAIKQNQTACQQMSITLKNALTKKTDDAYKTVLNWQYANGLILLSSFVCTCEVDDTLTHQVIQLNLGALGIMKSPRYYPYFCHLIENLINLGTATRQFIPVLPLIMSILDRIQLKKDKDDRKKANDSKDNNNKKVSNAKKDKKESFRRKDDDDEEEEDEDDDSEDEDEDDDKNDKRTYNMDLLNHVSLEETHLHEYNVAVLDKLHELLVELLASQCHKIAFPELVLFPCVQLKKWLKKNSTLESQKFKKLLEKIKADCDIISEERKSTTFVFTDYAAVDAWEKRMRDSNKLNLVKLSKKSNSTDYKLK